MRIIDLFNKIANGEEVPKKIKIGDEELYFSDFKNTYVFETGGSLNWSYYVSSKSLNDEVEIIEDYNKLIPKHLSNEFIQSLNNGGLTPNNIKCIAHKINEVINYIQHIEGKNNWGGNLKEKK